MMGMKRRVRRMYSTWGVPSASTKSCSSKRAAVVRQTGTEHDHDRPDPGRQRPGDSQDGEHGPPVAGMAPIAIGAAVDHLLAVTRGAVAGEIGAKCGDRTRAQSNSRKDASNPHSEHEAPIPGDGCR
jgi:hypothetical protein